MQVLVKGGWPLAGKRIVIAGSGPLLFAAAAEYRAAGADVALIAEQTDRARLVRFGLSLPRLAPGKILQAAKYQAALLGVPYRTGCWAVSAQGADRLEGVTLRSARKTWTERCDVLATGFGFLPNLELPRLLGCRTENGAAVVDDRQEARKPESSSPASRRESAGKAGPWSKASSRATRPPDVRSGPSGFPETEAGPGVQPGHGSGFRPAQRGEESGRSGNPDLPVRGCSPARPREIRRLARRQAPDTLRDGPLPGPDLRRGRREALRLGCRLEPTAGLSGPDRDAEGIRAPAPLSAGVSWPAPKAPRRCRPAPYSALDRHHPADIRDGIEGFVQGDGIRIAPQDEVRADHRPRRRDGVSRWQGISQAPWTGSQTEPMEFWRAMAAASQACRAEPPAISTTAAAAMAPATPISTWQPAVSAANPQRRAAISPTAEAANRARDIRSGPSALSSASVVRTPGRTPADPPVGAAQTMPWLLHMCIAAIARAAARA